MSSTTANIKCMVLSNTQTEGFINMSDVTNEQWLPIPGYEGLYSASNLGRIRSHGRTVKRGNGFLSVPDKIMKTPSDGKGYAHFNARKNGRTKTLWVHIVMMEAFVGPRPENNDIRHLDGNPSNNSLENLSYGTRAQNIGDAKKHGTFPVLEKRPGAKLTTQKAIEIAKSEETADVLAARYGVGTQAITDIRSGRNWVDVTRPFLKKDYRKRGACVSKKLTDKSVEKIFNSTLSHKKLAALYGVSRRLIWSIKNGRVWKSVTGG